MSKSQDPDHGKQERLACLIRRYEKDIRRICYLYLQDVEQAKDATQETFLKAYLNLDSLKDVTKEKSWLTRIAVNICRDHFRSSWTVHIDRHIRPEELRIAAEGSPTDETRIALTTAVMDLPQKYLETVILRYVQGYDIMVTARILGITPSAVSRRCKKACDLLKRELED